MAYQLEGRLLEVCDCNVLCPCWVGEDPDGGTCDAIAAWHVDRGSINGLDVSGLTFAFATHIPGNIFEGNWRVVAFVSEAATEEQAQALVDMWTGKGGGPLADFAQLIGEVVAVERAPIIFTVEGGKGTLRIGQAAEATLAPFQSPDGQVTKLVDSVFTTIPGSAAYVGKAAQYQRRTEQYGLRNLELQNHNAIQGTFHFEG